MRSVYSFIFALGFTCSVIATTNNRADAHTINNGGGLGEAHVAFLWQHLDTYLKVVRRDAGISIDAVATGLIDAVAGSIAEETAAGLPRFLSPSDDPNFFQQGGHTSAFQTGSHIGDSITFNLDFIYPKDPITQQSRPCSLGTCAALVFKAMVQHHTESHLIGMADAEKASLLARIGQRITAIADANARSFSLSSQGFPEIRTTFVNYSSRLTTTSSSAFLFFAYGSLHDLSYRLMEDLNSNATINGRRIVATRLENGRFGSLTNGLENLPILGEISAIVEDRFGAQSRLNCPFTMRAPLSPEARPSDRWVLDESQTSTILFYCIQQ